MWSTVIGTRGRGGLLSPAVMDLRKSTVLRAVRHLLFCLLAAAAFVPRVEAAPQQRKLASKECIECHQQVRPDGAKKSVHEPFRDAANCTACHNADPAKDGPLGPAIFGSSKELIEARVLRAEYPAGYTPKRKTKVMVALPQLKGDLDSLAAFLKN